MKRTRSPGVTIQAVAPNLDALRDAAQSNPLDFDAVLAFAWALYAKGDYAEAESAFARCGTLAPDDPEGIYGKGMALRAQDKRAAAVATFDEAAVLADRLSDRTRARMLHRLAIAHMHYLRDGDWGLEKEVWRR